MSDYILPTQRGSTITYQGSAEQEFQTWIEDITLRVNTLNNAIVNWGQIGGTITDQTDLVNYIGDFHTIQNEVSTDTTITEDTAQYNVDASGGDVTITLPALAPNKFFTIRRINAAGGNVIIDGGASTINGSATVTLVSQYTSLDVGYSDTEWGLL